MPRWLLRPLPAHLTARWRALDASACAELDAALHEHYFADSPPGYLDTPLGARDREDHSFRRLDHARMQVAPWLDATRRLDGARVLEIGCGTGSATVAFAEQGARVTGVDLCERSILAARRRCELHGVEAGFVLGNASEVFDKLEGERFHFIVFYASLEHMLQDERLAAMRSAWRLLAPGDFWCTVETPNRLWHHDGHTSFLPFFHWLPDDLAFAYSRKSPRSGFGDRYREPDAESRLHFLRRGRGVSYHEFDLALGPPERLDVVSSLRSFQRSRRRLPAWARRPRRRTRDERYRSLLAEIRPDLHEGFLEPFLDLLIRKPAGWREEDR